MPLMWMLMLCAKTLFKSLKERIRGIKMVNNRFIQWWPQGEDLYIDVFFEDEKGKVNKFTYKLGLTKKTKKARCRLIYDSSKKENQNAIG